MNGDIADFTGFLYVSVDALHTTVCFPCGNSLSLKGFFWPLNRCIDRTASEMTGNKEREREKGRVGDMQQGALGRDSNPKPCSEDEASAHGTPARPTGLKPARPNDFHGLFST